MATIDEHIESLSKLSHEEITRLNLDADEEMYSFDPDYSEVMARFGEADELKAAIRWLQDSSILNRENCDFLEHQGDKGNEHAKVLLAVLEGKS